MRSSSSRTVQVTIRGPGRPLSAVTFALPTSVPGPSGTAVVRREERAWHSLPTLAVHERPIEQPIPLGQSVSNAHVLGSATLRDRRVRKVSFFDSQLPAWFTIWVDRQTARTLELTMTAQAHFRHQVDDPFDRPLSIVPTTAGRA